MRRMQVSPTLALFLLLVTCAGVLAPCRARGSGGRSAPATTIARELGKCARLEVLDSTRARSLKCGVDGATFDGIVRPIRDLLRSREGERVGPMLKLDCSYVMTMWVSRDTAYMVGFTPDYQYFVIQGKAHVRDGKAQVSTAAALQIQKTPKWFNDKLTGAVREALRTGTRRRCCRPGSSHRV